MNSILARVGMLVSLSLLLAACATAPGGSTSAGGATTPSRPLSDVAPASEAEKRARVHVELGIAYFEIARYDVALDEAQIALREQSGYAPAYHLLGLTYMMIGEDAVARRNFQQALRTAPGDPEFNNSYGWFLCLQGEEERGLEHLAQAARNPYYRHATRPHTNAGLCYLRLGNDAAAETQFSAALEAEPGNDQALYELAAIAYRGGRYQQAHLLLVRLHQQRDPTAASAWLGLRTERRLGNSAAEASYAAQLRSRFEGSVEFEQMRRGEFE